MSTAASLQVGRFIGAGRVPRINSLPTKQHDWHQGDIFRYLDYGFVLIFQIYDAAATIYAI